MSGDIVSPAKLSFLHSYSHHSSHCMTNYMAVFKINEILLPDNNYSGC